MPYVYDNNHDEGSFDPGTHNWKEIDIYSRGPDRKTAVDRGLPEGDGEDEDDINNWR